MPDEKVNGNPTNIKGPAFNDGSTPVVVPAGVLGSKVRQSAWQSFWAKWGGKNEASREAQAEIDSIRKDIANHVADLNKYKAYQARGINVGQAIVGVQTTITSLQAAVAEKITEAHKDGLTVS